MAPSLKGYINQYGYALYNKFINIDDEKSKKITDYSSMGMGKSSTNYDKTNQDYSIAYNGKGDNSNYMIRAYYNRYDKEEYKGSKIMVISKIHLIL